MAKFFRFVGLNSVVSLFCGMSKEIKTHIRMKLEVCLYGALPLHSDFRGLM